MAELLIILVASFLGVLVATLWPYFRKLWEGKIDKFDWKYAYHLAVSAVWTFLLNFSVYYNWVPPVEFIFSDVLIYLLAFAFGFGGNEVQKELEKFLRYLWDKQKVTVVADDSG